MSKPKPVVSPTNMKSSSSFKLFSIYGFLSLAVIIVAFWYKWYHDQQLLYERVAATLESMLQIEQGILVILQILILCVLSLKSRCHG